MTTHSWKAASERSRTNLKRPITKARPRQEKRCQNAFATTFTNADTPASITGRQLSSNRSLNSQNKRMTCPRNLDHLMVVQAMIARIVEPEFRYCSRPMTNGVNWKGWESRLKLELACLRYRRASCNLRLEILCQEILLSTRRLFAR